MSSARDELGYYTCDGCGETTKNTPECGDVTCDECLLSEELLGQAIRFVGAPIEAPGGVSASPINTNQEGE